MDAQAKPLAGRTAVVTGARALALPHAALGGFAAPLCRVASRGRLTRACAGATHGIGTAIARGLAAQGADLVLVVRCKVRGRELAESISADAGVKADVVVADLSAQADVRAAARDIIKRFPAVHILVRGRLLRLRARAPGGPGGCVRVEASMRGVAQRARLRRSTEHEIRVAASLRGVAQRVRLRWRSNSERFPPLPRSAGVQRGRAERAPCAHGGQRGGDAGGEPPGAVSADQQADAAPQEDGCSVPRGPRSARGLHRLRRAALGQEI